MKKIKSISKKVFVPLLFAIALVWGMGPVGNSSNATPQQVIEPSDNCICGSIRIGGVCSGSTDQFCEGPADCKGICG